MVVGSYLVGEVDGIPNAVIIYYDRTFASIYRYIVTWYGDDRPFIIVSRLISYGQRYSPRLCNILRSLNLIYIAPHYNAI